MPTEAYVNRIATSVPSHDVHRFFINYAGSQLQGDQRRRAVFDRMSDTAGIAHRFSCLAPADDAEGSSVDAGGLFVRGAFPGTAARMDLFAEMAPHLAQSAVDKVLEVEDRDSITHLIVTTCTGFSAPGVDQEVVARCDLSTSAERTIIGFMGCYAAITALKQARHIVRSEPDAKVLVLNLELCTLHLKETKTLEKLLSFCLWGDGCAAALISARPVGIRLDSFHAIVARRSSELMTWNVRDDGFDMVLSGQVPAVISETLSGGIGAILKGKKASEIDLWAVHPGGRSVLDAVERTLDLDPRLPADDPSAIASRRDLVWINALMFQQAITASMLRRCLPRARASVLEIGSGDGTFMLSVARRLGRPWNDVDLVMIDQADLVTDQTRDAFAALGWRLNTIVTDVFDWAKTPHRDRFDVATANLFLHHFIEPALTELLASLAEISSVFIATEPRRNPLASMSCPLLKIIGCNHVTIHDAAASVRAGFTGKELTRLWPDGRSFQINESSFGPFTHRFSAARV